MPEKATAMTKAILDRFRARPRHPSQASATIPYVAGIGVSHRMPEALADDLAAAGIQRSSIVTEARIGIAGGYGISGRPWDAVVVDDELPVVVTEIKVNLGIGGNNLRNRLDDIVALATNIARTFDGPDRLPYRPCIAVVFVMEKSRDTVARRRPRPVDLSFPGLPPEEPTSYLDFVGHTLSGLLSGGVIDAACYLAADSSEMEVSEPFADLSFDNFAKRIVSYISRAAQTRSGSGLSAANLGRVLAHGNDVQEVVAGLTSTPEGLSAAEAAIIRERRRIISDLQDLALSPDANETKMHAAIGSRYWIFGGQYVGIADRRTFVPLDQYDIPLVCADGSLEIVELKGPEVTLVRKHRNHLIVSDDVHEAVSQCLNYLRHIDELGAALRTQYMNELQADFDFRRAKGTIVLGHPTRRLPDGVSREQVDQTIRSYNAHLSRLTVITYADLLESAERALRFESEESTRDGAS
ncbi:Shedu anti-phage system protein SduA domain-containing protein [Actinoplanes flavus]|uniref:DUF4263 domain-containing protein n=1 Tax=Actinoplanes flavus TaxID=2820290 RepID=A0ABS3V0K8_9ACTN|nr:Shedu anti-phage system protein SduA domain-containing protein [Actinoplanes flavus]MBO3744368.1 DUF4263 domain-containing protein [Actinoplanes flavus]